MSQLLALLMSHAIADFPLQSDFMAKGKNRHVMPSFIPPGQKRQTTWPYVLTAHALVHGAGVWLVTGVWWLGLAETVAHWLIDFGKCENWYGIHQDQGLHILCKVIWWII